MSRFKLFSFLSILLLGFLTLFSWPSHSQATTDKNHYLVATDVTFAPFEFEKDGKYVGIDMDLLAAIAEDQGFTYELKPLGFDAAVQALEAEQVDAVIAGMSITEERKATFDFTDPYFQSGLAIAVQEGSDIISIEDLKGQKVAVKRGTEGAHLNPFATTFIVI